MGHESAESSVCPKHLTQLAQSRRCADVGRYVHPEQGAACLLTSNANETQTVRFGDVPSVCMRLAVVRFRQESPSARELQLVACRFAPPVDRGRATPPLSAAFGLSLRSVLKVCLEPLSHGAMASPHLREAHTKERWRGRAEKPLSTLTQRLLGSALSGPSAYLMWS